MKIGFSRPKTFKPGSALIMAWMRAPYSHIYLRVYSQYTQQWLVYQASHGEVHCLTFDNFLRQNIVVEEFDPPMPVDQRTCVTKAQQLLQVPYGYWGLVKIFLARLGLKLPGDGYSSFHCSELIVALMPELLTNSHICPDYIEPVHIYKLLKR